MVGFSLRHLSFNLVLCIQDALYIFHDLLGLEPWIHVGLQCQAQDFHISQLPEIIVSFTLEAIKVGTEVQDFLDNFIAFF